MSIFKEGVHYVLCPECFETTELGQHSHKYKALTLGGVTETCKHCGKPFRIVPVVTYRTEKK